MSDPWVAPDVPSEAPPPRPAGAASTRRDATAGRPEVPVPLRPLATSERVDGALRILKLAPGTVLALTAVAVVPIELLTTVLLRLGEDPLPRALFGAPFASAVTDDRGTSGVVPVVFLLLDALALAWVASGLAQLVTGWHVGRRDDTATILRASASRLPALLGAVVLVRLAEAVGLVLFLVGALVPMTWFALVAPVIGAERLGALKALGRSFALTKRAFGTVFATCLLVAVVAVGLRVCLAVLGAFALDAALPGDWVLVTAVGIAVRLVVEPLVAGAAVLLYLDLRVRREGLDIELAAIDRMDRARARRFGLVALVLVLLLVPASAGAEPPPSTHDPAAVRKLADDILAREEFQPPERTLLQRFLDWLDPFGGDSGDGGGSTSEGSSAGTGGSGALTAILLVLAVVGVGFVVYSIARQPRRRRPDDDADPEVELEPHLGVDEWMARAARAEAEGRWKDGLRARFRALVEQLIDARVVPEVAGRTTGELRRDVEELVPAGAAPFALAAELFDRAWYGDLPTGAAEARRFAEAADVVLAEVRNRPAPVPAAPEPTVEADAVRGEGAGR